MKVRKKDDLIHGAFVWRPQPWLPSEYPKSAKDVLELLEAASPEAHTLIQQLLMKDVGQGTVVVGAPTINGPCLCAITIVPSQNKYRQQSPERGFRRGKTPAAILRSRCGKSCEIVKADVCRVDAEWVHGRGKDARAKKLQDASVAVLGCGSIGSAVAVGLAQAGVGSLVLVDHDRLSPANIGRHPLGADQLFAYKTEALAFHVRRRFPHISSVRTFENRWEDVARSHHDALAKCDIIVSTMGNWGSESALNQWHVAAGRQKPIVYGWAEPFACAGHAVAIVGQDSCLRCGLSSLGVSKVRVTEWSSDTLEQEPGCGTVYQPYGPAELGHIIGVITELTLDCILKRPRNCVHRIWSGARTLLAECGGSWSPEWAARFRGPNEGTFLITEAWPRDEQCTCQQSMTHD